MAMNGEQLRDEYIDALLDRVTEVRYPSLELIDRAKTSSTNGSRRKGSLPT